MKILLVSATLFEIQPLLNSFKHKKLSSAPQLYSGKISASILCDVLITGPGLHHTAFYLGRHLVKNNYDLAINAGICGSFKNKFPVGTIVHIQSETLSDFGAENKKNFIPASKIKLYALEEKIIVDDSIKNTSTVKDVFNHLPIANAITVNTVHGNTESIQRIKNKLNPDVESMEGFAFFYACRFADIPFYAIRSISNMVEPRNTNNWKIDLAISNLNAELIKSVNQLKS